MKTMLVGLLCATWSMVSCAPADNRPPPRTAALGAPAVAGERTSPVDSTLTSATMPKRRSAHHLDATARPTDSNGAYAGRTPWEPASLPKDAMPVRRTPTAADQGTTAEERRITANVRTAMVADTELTLGENVTIVTMGTKVTLVGSVTSTGERTAIKAYAAHTPGVTSVDDQLVVRR